MRTQSTHSLRLGVCIAALALLCTTAGVADGGQRAAAPAKAPTPSTKGTPATTKTPATWPPPSLIAAESAPAPAPTAPTPTPAAVESATAPASAAPEAPASTPAAAVRAPAVSPSPTIPSATDYRLGAGDKLRVEVYRDAQLSQSVQVRPDGKITLPLIGDIEASGRTPLQLRDSLTTALREYVNNPAVTVIVVEAMAAMAYVIGEVNQPGPIVVNSNMTVVQALAMAGGLGEWAKESSIRIQRPTASGIEIIPFDYKKATSKAPSDPVYVRPGDTIVVPD